MSAIQGVIEFYNKIKALFDSLLTNVAAAGAAIMADPIGFAKNLFSGVGQGISNFMSNIGQHLQTGLIGWLTGASASLGITMPDNLFSAKGIFSLVTQVLGLSWNAVRGIGAQVIGERTIGILEKGFNLVMILKNEGITGLWEHLKESFINLKDQVIGQIKEMVITTVINAGMKWLLSLMNPAGALVKIVMGIVKVVQFIIERAASILELVDAFVQSIGAIAKGDVGAVAKNIEEALKRGIPLLIGMLANFLGLGSIARKVSKMLKKLRKPIVKGIKKLWMKLKRMGRKFLRKFRKKRPKGQEPGKPDPNTDELDKPVEFDAKTEHHKLWFEEKGSKEELWVASNNPRSVTIRLAEWEDQLKGVNTPEAQKAKTLIKRAKGETKSLNLDKEALEEIMSKQSKSSKLKKKYHDGRGNKKRRNIRKRQENLSNLLAKLFDYFEVEDQVKVKKGDIVSAKYKEGKRYYLTMIKSVLKLDKKIKHQFQYEMLTERDETLSFSDFNEKVESGDIKFQRTAYQKIMDDANALDEPLRTLYIGAKTRYRSNLLDDLRLILDGDEGIEFFKKLYKNAPNDFKNKLKQLNRKKDITKADLVDLFKGYEAHHVIPANFLKNNRTVQKLLKGLQPLGVSFGYNNLDNLIFIPDSNHTKGNQRGHKKYDEIIEKKIESSVAPLIRKEKYEKALERLEKIISNVKQQFINDIIGSSKNANDVK